MSKYSKAVLETGAGRTLTFTSRGTAGKADQWLIDVKGWYGGGGIRDFNTVRPSSAGYFPEPNLKSGRPLTLEGLVDIPEDDNYRFWYMRELSGTLNDGGFHKLTVWTGDKYLYTRVKLDGEIGLKNVGDNAMTVQIPLMAADPRLYGPNKNYKIYPEGSTGGLAYPLFEDNVLDYGDNALSTSMLYNDGNTRSYPVFTVHGTWPKGFRLQSGAAAVEYPHPINHRTPVTVDMLNGSVTIQGQNRAYLLSRRRWFSIAAHHFIRPKATSPVDVSGCWVDVVVRDTYY